MDLKIQQHLAESSQDQPLKKYVNFIMATNIGLLTFVFVDIISDKCITVFNASDTC